MGQARYQNRQQFFDDCKSWISFFNGKEDQYTQYGTLILHWDAFLAYRMSLDLSQQYATEKENQAELDLITQFNLSAKHYFLDAQHRNFFPNQDELISSFYQFYPAVLQFYREDKAAFLNMTYPQHKALLCPLTAMHNYPELKDLYQNHRDIYLNMSDQDRKILMMNLAACQQDDSGVKAVEFLKKSYTRIHVMNPKDIRLPVLDDVIKKMKNTIAEDVKHNNLVKAAQINAVIQNGSVPILSNNKARLKNKLSAMITIDLINNPLLNNHRDWAFKIGRAAINILSIIGGIYKLSTGYWLFDRSTRLKKDIEIFSKKLSEDIPKESPTFFCSN